MLFTSISQAFVQPTLIVDKRGDVAGISLHPAQKASMALDVAIGATLIALAILNPFGLSTMGQGLLLGAGIAYTASTVFHISTQLKAAYLKHRGFINVPKIVSLETGRIIENFFEQRRASESPILDR